MSDCILTMKSRTAAESALRDASSRGIRARVVSVDPHITKNGCSYGLRIPCAEAEKLKAEFRKKGISYGELIGGSL